jgi:DNA-binding MarR family transcriptional regulator
MMRSSRKRQEMPSGYGIVQKVVMRMGGLSITSKAVYALLASYTGATRYCWPSQKTIAADLGISRSSVLRSLSELERANLVKRSKLYDDFRRNNKYKLMVIRNLPEAPARHMQTVTGDTFEAVSSDTQKINREEEQAIR